MGLCSPIRGVIIAVALLASPSPLSQGQSLPSQVFWFLDEPGFSPCVKWGNTPAASGVVSASMVPGLQGATSLWGAEVGFLQGLPGLRQWGAGSQGLPRSFRAAGIPASREGTPLTVFFPVEEPELPPDSQRGL